MTSFRPTLAVTGASGFIAAGILEMLCAEDARATAFSRGPAPERLDPRINWLSLQGYTDNATLRAGFAGIDCVVHLADDPHRGNSRDPRTSIDIADALIEAMRHSGVKRAILASSVYARSVNGAPLSSYGAGKAAVEQRFLSAPDIQPVVLRLPPVYGPGGRGGMATLAGLVRRRVPLPFGMAHAPRAYLSRNNLTSLVSHMASSDEARWASASGRIFEPSDGRSVSTRELISMIAERIGVPATNIALPTALLRAVGRLAGRSELIAGALDQLEVESPRSLEDAFGWRAQERMPESLAFLAQRVTPA